MERTAHAMGRTMRMATMKRMVRTTTMTRTIRTMRMRMVNDVTTKTSLRLLSCPRTCLPWRLSHTSFSGVRTLGACGGVRSFSTTEENIEMNEKNPMVEENLKEILELIEEKKGADIEVLSVDECPKMQNIAQYTVITTCTSRRHMRIVSEHIVEHFRLKGMLVEQHDEDENVINVSPSIEGLESDRWMLIDLNEIVFHAFTQEGREYYNIAENLRNENAVDGMDML
eukprot:756698-Hanusia_phi.AAC.1